LASAISNNSKKKYDYLTRSQLNALCGREAAMLARALNEAAPGTTSKKQLLWGLRMAAKHQCQSGLHWFDAALKNVFVQE